MIKRYTAQIISSFLAVVAVTFVTADSALLVHKPEPPAELLKKKA